MAFVTLDTSQMVVPVLIPRAESPAVSGINSSWLIAGGVGTALLLAWLLFGSKVQKAVAATRSYVRRPRKVAKKRK